jgi:hypothetical protein
MEALTTFRSGFQLSRGTPTNLPVGGTVRFLLLSGFPYSDVKLGLFHSKPGHANCVPQLVSPIDDMAHLWSIRRNPRRYATNNTMSHVLLLNRGSGSELRLNSLTASIVYDND